tara:strand:- start:590 stop:757 length:168 start_codon:yes stop_codon:yes gene_type:complete
MNVIVEITTARLPQKDRQLGMQITLEKKQADILVGQGFAKHIPQPPKKLQKKASD